MTKKSKMEKLVFKIVFSIGKPKLPKNTLKVAKNCLEKMDLVVRKFLKTK